MALTLPVEFITLGEYSLPLAVTLITSCRCYPSRRGHSPALIPVRCRRLCSAGTLRAPHSCCCVAYLQVALEATPRNLTKKYTQTPRPPLPLPPPPPTSPLLHPLLSPLLRIENCALLYPTLPSIYRFYPFSHTIRMTSSSSSRPLPFAAGGSSSLTTTSIYQQPSAVGSFAATNGSTSVVSTPQGTPPPPVALMDSADSKPTIFTVGLS